MAYDWKTEIPGVYGLHEDGCPKRLGRRCTCGVLGYRSILRDPGTHERLYSPLFNTKDSARSWSSDQLEAVKPARAVSPVDPPATTVRDAALPAGNVTAATAAAIPSLSQPPAPMNGDEQHIEDYLTTLLEAHPEEVEAALRSIADRHQPPTAGSTPERPAERRFSERLFWTVANALGLVLGLIALALIAQSL